MPVLGLLPVCSYAARPPKTSGAVTKFVQIAGKAQCIHLHCLGQTRSLCQVCRTCVPVREREHVSGRSLLSDVEQELFIF